VHELRRPGRPVRNTAHLHERDTTIAVVSRAPIDKIERWKHKMGWTFPGTRVTAAGSTSTTAFRSTTPSTIPITTTGPPPNWTAEYGLAELPSELHGTSVFLRSTIASPHLLDLRARHRTGWRTHYYLDMTALGRQEIGEPRAARKPWTARRPGGSGAASNVS